MKYIIFKVEGEQLDRRIPIVFPNFMVHSLVFKYMRHMLRVEHKCHVEAVSAGEIVGFLTSDLSCGGESETLNLKSRGDEDAEIIKGYDYFAGL